MAEHTLEINALRIPNASGEPWLAQATCTADAAIDAALAVQVARDAIGGLRDAPIEVAAGDLAHDLALRVPCRHVRVVVEGAAGQGDDAPRVRYAVERGAGAAPGDADGEAVPVEMVSRAAVVSMESALPNAPELMRATIVAIDGIPGTQVEGISPLYHVMDPDGGSANSAVLALRTTMSLGQLSNMLQAMHETHEGAVKLAVVDMERPAPRDRERLGEAHRAAARAAVLSPWMDMDPNATLDGDPLAFLLASAPDAPFVGMQSDNWIIGGAR